MHFPQITPSKRALQVDLGSRDRPANEVNKNGVLQVGFYSGKSANSPSTINQLNHHKTNIRLSSTYFTKKHPLVAAAFVTPDGNTPVTSARM